MPYTNSPLNALITVKRNVYAVKLNDEVVGCERWHARLNRKAVSGQLPFYKLLDLLRAESKLLSVTAKTLSERKVQRRQRKSTKNVQHRLFTLWDEFDAGMRSTTSLLKACSYCYV